MRGWEASDAQPRRLRGGKLVVVAAPIRLELGAMMTDKYLHVHYIGSTAEFVELMRSEDREIIAIDNIPGSVNMSETTLPQRAVLVFGQEGPGISEGMVQAADKIVAIEQFGSTRSINVGAAATVAMYCWLQQYVLR